MAIRIDSESSARAAYIDYYTNENTSVTKADIDKIKKRYDNETRRSWQAAFEQASGDVNKYEFEDEDFENIRSESYNNNKEMYGKDVDDNEADAINIGQAYINEWAEEE